VSEPQGGRDEQLAHPDPEVLAEFRAGLITGRRGARISAHLAACDHCTGLCGKLAEISALLAVVPAPAMPATVTQRLESVLAAEAAH
jgi:anti-sigma factor ChrR (cupin superfamily)